MSISPRSGSTPGEERKKKKERIRGKKRRQPRRDRATCCNPKKKRGEKGNKRREGSDLMPRKPRLNRLIEKGGGQKRRGGRLGKKKKKGKKGARSAMSHSCHVYARQRGNRRKELNKEEKFAATASTVATREEKKRGSERKTILSREYPAVNQGRGGKKGGEGAQGKRGGIPPPPSIEGGKKERRGKEGEKGKGSSTTSYHCFYELKKKEGKRKAEKERERGNP